MSPEITAAIIASSISLVGILLSIYLSKKTQKHELAKLNSEYELIRMNQSTLILKDFISSIQAYKYHLIDLKSILNNSKSEDKQLKKLHKSLPNYMMKLKDSWYKVSSEFKDLKMQKSMSIAEKLHDESSRLSAVNFTFDRLINNLDSKKSKKELLNLIESTIISLDELIDIIRLERK